MFRLVSKSAVQIASGQKNRFCTSRIASGEHHNKLEGKDEEYTRSDFSGPFWRNVFVCSLAAVGVWQANAYYEATKHDQVHPITAYISYHMTQEDKWKKTNYQSIEDMERAACDTLLIQELKGTPRSSGVVSPEYVKIINKH